MEEKKVLTINLNLKTVKILYKFSSRSRPSKLISCIENIISMARHDNYTILVSLDVDDATVSTRSFNEKLFTYKNVKPVYGFSKNKTHAINRDIWMVNDWDVIICMSDDFVFLVDGFDLDIISQFPSIDSGIIDTDLFLHYPDGSPCKDVLCTMSIMGRRYFDRFGYIYNPEYLSVYSDNEATTVARILGKYRYIDRQIASHDHPAWGKGEMDDLYRLNENKDNYAIDKSTYDRRVKINFEL